MSLLISLAPKNQPLHHFSLCLNPYSSLFEVYVWIESELPSQHFIQLNKVISDAALNASVNRLWALEEKKQQLTLLETLLLWGLDWTKTSSEDYNITWAKFQGLKVHVCHNTHAHPFWPFIIVEHLQKTIGGKAKENDNDFNTQYNGHLRRKSRAEHLTYILCSLTWVLSFM